MVTRVTELPTFLPVKGGLSLSLKPGLTTMVTLLIYLFFVFLNCLLILIRET